MKWFILATIGLIATPTLAESAKNVSGAKNSVIGTTQEERRAALEEMRGRAQLEMLINQVVEEEEMIETHGWGYERRVASKRPS
jgi:hypothetical protein